MYVSVGYSILDKEIRTLDHLKDCKCLPACLDIKYEFETVQFFKNWTENSTKTRM